nr:hypothetical protein [Lacipirellula limnantheis]
MYDSETTINLDIGIWLDANKLACFSPYLILQFLIAIEPMTATNI